VEKLRWLTQFRCVENRCVADFVPGRQHGHEATPNSQATKATPKGLGRLYDAVRDCWMLRHRADWTSLALGRAVWRRAAFASFLVCILLSLGAARENGNVATRIVRCAEAGGLVGKDKRDSKLVTIADVTIHTKRNVSGFDLLKFFGRYLNDKVVCTFGASQYDCLIANNAVANTIVRSFGEVSYPIKKMSLYESGTFSPLANSNIINTESASLAAVILTLSSTMAALSL
jgi:hypothetical protein